VARCCTDEIDERVYWPPLLKTKAKLSVRHSRSTRRQPTRHTCVGFEDQRRGPPHHRSRKAHPMSAFQEIADNGLIASFRCGPMVRGFAGPLLSYVALRSSPVAGCGPRIEAHEIIDCKTLAMPSQNSGYIYRHLVALRTGQSRTALESENNTLASRVSLSYAR